MKLAVKQLRARMTNGNGKLHRGSVSRVSEYLDVARSTVVKWLDGEWTPGMESVRNIQTLLKNPSAHLGAFKPGPKTPVA